MKYFKAEEFLTTKAVYVRHVDLAQAKAVFAFFKSVHPMPEHRPLTPVNRLKGWWMFRGIPKDHEVVWETFEGGTEFVTRSTSRGDLFHQQPSSQ